MKIITEFKEFAMKGNVLDMAIGIILGGAFGKIVSSLVTDVLMPPLGLLIGGVDFSDLRITLKHEVLNAAGAILSPAVSINYGKFVQSAIDFTLVALAIFILIKGINRLRKKSAEPAEAAVPPAPTKQEVLLTEIRDILGKK